MKNFTNPNSYEHLFKTSTTTERTRQVQELFSRIAGRYDLMNRMMSLGLDLRWRHVAIQQAKFKPDSRILDLGIGTGDMAVKLLQQVPNCRLVGIDNCRELMRLGQKKSRLKRASPAIQMVQGDGRFFPFDDNIFDGVVAGFSVRNIPDSPRVISEIYRVLVPGGKCVLLEMVPPDGKLNQILFKLYFKRLVPLLGKWFGSDVGAYAYLYPSITNFLNSDQIKQALQAEGFTSVRVQNFMFRIVTLCIAEK